MKKNKTCRYCGKIPHKNTCVFLGMSTGSGYYKKESWAQEMWSGFLKEIQDTEITIGDCYRGKMFLINFIRQLLETEREKRVMALDNRIVKEMRSSKEFQKILDDIKNQTRKETLEEVEKKWTKELIKVPNSKELHKMGLPELAKLLNKTEKL